MRLKRSVARVASGEDITSSMDEEDPEEARLMELLNKVLSKTVLKLKFPSCTKYAHFLGNLLKGINVLMLLSNIPKIASTMSYIIIAHAYLCVWDAQPQAPFSFLALGVGRKPHQFG